MLHWDRPFQTVRAGSFVNGDIVWFPEGGLNASYNCVDRWAFKNPDKVNLFIPLIVLLFFPKIDANFNNSFHRVIACAVPCVWG